MIGLRTRREEELVCPHLEDLTALLKYQIRLLPSNTTVRILKNRYSGEVGKACELDYDLNTCRFIEHEITESPIFNPATDF